MSVQSDELNQKNTVTI